LSFWRKQFIFAPCLFTNFIAKSATKTARFSFDQAIGRERNARIAVRQKSKRNFLRSLRARLANPLQRAKAAAVAAAVRVMDIDLKRDA
jgi:hypothetical protein